MTPLKYTHSGTIAAPIDDVFQLLTDPKRIPEWFPSCTDVTAPGPSLTKGTRFTIAIAANRGPREVVAEVIEYAPPTIFGWAEQGPRRNAKTFYRLKFNGASTGISVQYVSTPSGLLGHLRAALLTRRETARLFERSIQNLQLSLMR